MVKREDDEELKWVDQLDQKEKMDLKDMKDDVQLEERTD